MKKLITIVILMGFGVFVNGQVLPNNDFQTWNDFGLYERPEFWSTPDSITSKLSTVTVSKSTDAYSGSYSARLETKSIPLIGYQIPGILTLAKINIVVSPPSYSISGGYALKENVSRLSGMYKYSGAGGDSATVLIYNFKNDEGSAYDTIGFGVTYLHDASEWTEFNVDMINLNYHVPDTFNVLIMSSSSPDFSSGEGSVLFVDDLTIETNTGIFQLNTNAINVSVFPNPATDYVNFKTAQSANDRKIEIYSIKGEKIASKDFVNTNLKINTSEYSEGIYTFRISKNGNILNTGSFIKN